MAEKTSPRWWATPLTIGAFLLMAITGILMFFEQDRGLIVVVHQWSSWLLVIGAVGHIVANFRPLKNHLKSGWGTVSVAAFGAILVASWFSWGLVTGPQLKRPIEQALVDAPLSVLARMNHVDPSALVAKLSAHGIDADSEQSIGELSRKYRLDENRLLGMVFLLDNGGQRHAPGD